MRKSKRRTSQVISIMLAFVAMFSLMAVNAGAYNTFTDHGIQNRPLTFYAYTSTPSMYITALQTGMSTWNNAGYGTMFTYGGTAYVPPVNTANGQNGFRADNWGVTAAYAITTSYFDSNGYLQEADIHVNSYYDYTISLLDVAYKYDLISVVTHELGHALGLNESYVSGATMYYTMGMGETYMRTLHSDDYAGLAALY